MEDPQWINAAAILFCDKQLSEWIQKMRELVVISGLMFLGYLAEGSIRYFLEESCRVYVESASTVTAEEIIEDAVAASKSQANGAFIKMTASDDVKHFSLARQ